MSDEKRAAGAAGHYPVSAETFIRCWQSSATVQDVAAAFGMSNRSASMRALYYRRHGVPMKSMKPSGGPHRQDWDALARLAEESLK